MKSFEVEHRKKYFNVLTAVAEGIWNGAVVSGVLVVSALLIKMVLVVYS